MSDALAIFVRNCEEYANEKAMPLNYSKLYGLVVVCGLYVGAEGNDNSAEAIKEQALSIWRDFGEDFSCMPNTGIWEIASADNCLMLGLDCAATVEEFYEALTEFFRHYVVIFCM